MLIKRISELKPDDVFIWGDADTRSNMCVSGEGLGRLICTNVEPIFGDGNNAYATVCYRPKSGGDESRWYRKSDIALVADDLDLSNLVHHEVLCTQCGDRYGRHNGLDCKTGEHFVPCEALMRLHMPEYNAYLRRLDGIEDDFFSSIGL